MSTISVRFHFAAGHRILGLTGAGAKCSNPHGHTFYVTFVFEQSTQWPPAVEFGAVKATLRARIKDRYDHGFFVDKADDAMRKFLEQEGCRHHVFDGPPTTERIAELLAREARLLVNEAYLLRVVVEEGPENTATYEAS
jgi:6-pyruvoyltetrahydropterin/6-carboxytetrahydropterin synthase